MTVHDGKSGVDCWINGRPVTLEGGPAEPLSAVLRRHGMYSVRETCGLGVCGTCTVLLDDDPVSSCILPLYAVEGRRLRTTEGLADVSGELSDLQQGFIEAQAFQCSFCTPGFLMSATALLEQAPDEVDDDAIEAGLQGHLCRCGCYETIKEAVRGCSRRSPRVRPTSRRTDGSGA